MHDFSDELILAKNASIVASEILVNQKENFNEILSDEGRDIKLKADLASESAIKDYLKSKSGFPILAEESGADQDIGNSFWIVDPLDGTSNYSRDFPICCISIALMHEDEIVLGVINDFNRNDIYESTINSVSKLNGKDISVSSITDISKATLTTGFPAKGRFDKDFIEEFTEDSLKWKKVRMIGSAAMSCAYVASGQFDQYQEKGIFLWDVAAGLSLIKSAGGSFSYNSHSDNKFKLDVIANNGSL